MLHLWYYFKRKTQQTFKPVILITGCSSGIGLATAKQLNKIKDYRVIITARKESIKMLHDKFQESEHFLIRTLDVTDEKSRNSLIQEISKKWDGINILINNAGITYRSVVEHMTDADEFAQMTTNYLGPVGLIRAVLPYMREKGRGKIINISSVSGMLAMPTMASYTASKYALEGMSEALWYETKPLGINVTLVQPGFIHSQSFKKVHYTESSKPEESSSGPYSDYYANMTPFIEKLMKLSWATPDKIAKLILKVIRTENPPLWVPATFDAFIFYYIRRILPRRLLLPFLFWALPGARKWGHGYTRKRDH